MERIIVVIFLKDKEFMVQMAYHRHWPETLEDRVVKQVYMQSQFSLPTVPLNGKTEEDSNMEFLTE